MDQADLQAKIKLLRDSSYFTSDTAEGALAEKQSIVLVLCGKKPVAEVTTGHWTETADGRTRAPEDHAKLGEFLTSLGVAFSLHSDEYGTDAVIALDQSQIEAFTKATQADDAATVGRLFGYPPTATEAFVTGTLMELDNQDVIMQSHDLPLFMPIFRFSKQHAQDEVKVLQDWYQTLQAHHFV